MTFKLAQGLNRGQLKDPVHRLLHRQVVCQATHKHVVSKIPCQGTTEMALEHGYARWHYSKGQRTVRAR